MLSFLDGIVQPLADWQAQAEQHFQDHSSVVCFQASVARLWRLEHALRNGHQNFRQAALDAQQWLAAWIDDDPQIQALAEKLLNLLERTVSLRQLRRRNHQQRFAPLHGSPSRMHRFGQQTIILKPVCFMVQYA